MFKFQQPYKCCIEDSFKEFSVPALSLLKKLLAIEPSDRETASLALASEVSTSLCMKFICTFYASSAVFLYDMSMC